jgi:hypothetical protein
LSICLKGNFFYEPYIFKINHTNRLVTILILVIFSAGCERYDFSYPVVENGEIDYINYNSEIFSGNDTLIYGDWRYLFSIGGYYVPLQRIDKGYSILSIKPIGNYAKINKENNVDWGKILVLGQKYNHLRIQFCRSGIKPEWTLYYTLSFNRSDTLVLDDSACDGYADYYKRIK